MTSPDGWFRIRAKPRLREARGPLTEDESVLSIEGELPAPRGYYVLREVGDERYSWPVAPEVFEKQYEPADDE